MSKICFPNAKINLGLNVVGKRNDGFHDLETVFYPIKLCDALEFVPSSNIEFKNTGLEVGGDMQQNLVVKAWQLLSAEFGIPPVSIHLHKRIPFGAGLGGGSSDAAFMLVSLNSYFELNLSEQQLMERASIIGSDCAFFIRNRASFARGRGEILEDLSIDLSPYRILLVNPGIHVPTKDAFASIKPRKPEHSIKEVLEKPIETWKNLLTNDFETSIFPKYPEIASIKEKLYELGALYAAMTGSGSSVYGVFEQETEYGSTFDGYFVWE